MARQAREARAQRARPRERRPLGDSRRGTDGQAREARAQRARLRVSGGRSALAVAARTGLGFALALVGAACESAPVVPPYGFAQAREQRFSLEAVDETTIDGTPVKVRRVSEFRLELDPVPSEFGHEIALHLERYWLSVEGPPEVASEFALSEKGLYARSPRDPEQRLGPTDPGPSGATLRTLLARPIASFIARSNGEVVGTPWHARDALIYDVPVLDWLLLCLPVVESSASWSGTRALPALGQYQFGFDFPLRYERVEAPLADGVRVRASGVLSRHDVHVANGLAGDVELDHTGETDFDANGRLREARGELRLRFSSPAGTRVDSRHRVSIHCTDCDGPVNPAPARSDTHSG